jgi:predicted butyrate kinase (DUF1464 family)
VGTFVAVVVDAVDVPVVDAVDVPVVVVVLDIDIGAEVTTVVAVTNGRVVRGGGAEVPLSRGQFAGLAAPQLHRGGLVEQSCVGGI